MANTLEDSFTTKDAVLFAADHFGVPSFYAMAKALSDETLTVQPIQLSKYVNKGARMSKKVAERFFDTYGIVVNDVFERGAFRRK